MAKRKRAGKNAQATILTRMIKPRQPIRPKDHRSDIVLVEQSVDDGKKCYRFRYAAETDPDAPLMTATARWVRVEQEGPEGYLFEQDEEKDGQEENGFVEPSIKWGDSQARRYLYNDLVKNLVPRNAKDANNKSTMPLKEIYNMRPELYHQYDYKKFSNRLSRLRTIVRKQTNRA